MNRYQRILVCIDEPQRDARMLPYVRAIARLAESEEIHLLHVAAGPDHEHEATPDESADEAPVTVEALRRIAAEHIEDLPPHECLCEVVPGAPLLEICATPTTRTSI